MRKIGLLFLLFIAFTSTSYAKKTVNMWGCTEWKSSPGRDGKAVNEWRECTNIFGRKRLEIRTQH